MRECLAVRIIFVFIGPCISHLTRWGYFTTDDICKCISGFHTRLHDLKKSFDIRIFIHKGKICQTTCIDGNNDMLIHAADIRKLLFFFFCQIIIAFCIKTVCTFSCNTAENIDCNFCICLCDWRTCRHSEWCGGIHIKETRYLIFQFGCFFFDLVTPCISGCLILSVIVFNPVFCCDLKSGIFHTLIDANCLTFIHITRTSSSFDRSGSSNTIKCNLGSFFQWEKLSFIFQKYHSFCRCSSGNLTVLQFSFGYCIVSCTCEMSCLNGSHSTISSSS